MASSGTRGQLDTSSLGSSGAQRGDTNHCKPGTQHVWCLPRDYNLEKHPFSCELGAGTALNIANPASLDFTLVNKSLPWDYDFRFVIEEISNIDDKAQV